MLFLEPGGDRQTAGAHSLFFFPFVHKNLEEIVDASIMPQLLEYLQLVSISLTYSGHMCRKWEGFQLQILFSPPLITFMPFFSSHTVFFLMRALPAFSPLSSLPHISPSQLCLSPTPTIFHSVERHGLVQVHSEEKLPCGK